MVYSNILTSDNNNNNNNNFETLGLGVNSKSVKIVYNGSGIHTITGPVPFISISRKPSTNESGYLNSIPVSVNLNGKIVRNGVDTGLSPTGTGTQSIFGAIENLRNLFIGSGTDNYNGVLKILCGGTTATDGTEIFNASGVRLVNFTADKTTDNWITTADYNIDLEFYERRFNDSGIFIKTSNDNWNIEPIEDYIYTNTSYFITQRSEYHNPKLKPTAPTDANPVPSISLGGGSTAPTLSIQTIPRFKITRQVSAVGVPNGTGNIATNSAYKEAKKWVENRLSQSFNNAESGVAYFFQATAIPTNFSYLYNHLRTTNFNITAGSYEVTETWLAMPTGFKYIEDYSIETSTDEKYIKTVRVQGEIQGLSLVDLSVMSGSSGYLNTSNNNSVIDLSGSTKYTSQTSATTSLLDNSTNNSEVTTFSQNKYVNAFSGWIADIKPYLYRRACLGMNSGDRDKAYVNPAMSTSAPGNPIYSNETLLNVIPVSTTEAHNPRKGTISYNYEYNNRFTYISGVISCSVNVNNTNPADIIGEAFVLGRRLGPVLQNLGARTAAKKDVTVEVVVIPPSSLGGFLLTSTECPLFTGGTVYGTIDTIVEGLRPFGTRTSIFGSFDTRTSPNEGSVYKTSDSQSWNPVDGRYSRSVGWTYQPCTNSRNFLDH